MSIAVDTSRLRIEMVRRGWDAIDLARASRLSPATVSAALSGRPIAAKSLALIAAALLKAPAVETIDKLIARDEVDVGVA